MSRVNDKSAQPSNYHSQYATEKAHLSGALLWVTIFAALATSLSAQVQTDCDLDGISDPTVITTSGTETKWSCVGSTSGADNLDTIFGLGTDSPAPAQWLTHDEMAIAIIRPSNSSLVWKLLENSSTVIEKRFGKAGDNTLAGGDFDGNGVADAAVVRFDGASIRWQVRSDLFGRSTLKRSFLFGAAGDRVFFFNPYGLRDHVAAFGGSGSRARLQFRDVKTGKTRTFTRFPSILAKDPRPRPFPVQAADGSDYIAFALEDESDTTIRVFNYRGRGVGRHIFPGKGTVTVGDFDPDSEGEEIALSTSSTRYIYNPAEGSIQEEEVITGTPIDEININVVGAIATPTPTPEEE